MKTVFLIKKNLNAYHLWLYINIKSHAFYGYDARADIIIRLAAMHDATMNSIFELLSISTV